MDKDIRWKQRFDNFQRAMLLLQEVPELEISVLSPLEKEGIIQRFMFTIELGWKTLRDKMEFDGLLLDKISPKIVLKKAYKNKYIDDIDTWLEIIDERNILSNTYDFETFEKVIPVIQHKYTPILTDLYTSLAKDYL